jgi:hypothetical protein
MKKIKQLYCLNNACCKLNTRWINNVKVIIALARLKGATFGIFLKKIQWNVLEV